MPCPHFDIRVVQRSEGQSAVAAAAYQSGEKLYSQYDKEIKSYDSKEGITHTEIMLPPNAPREYATHSGTPLRKSKTNGTHSLPEDFILSSQERYRRSNMFRLCEITAMSISFPKG